MNGPRAERMSREAQVRVLAVIPAQGARAARLSVTKENGKPFVIEVPDAEQYKTDDELIFTRKATNLDDASERGTATKVKKEERKEAPLDTPRERQEELGAVVGTFDDDAALERYFGETESTKGPVVAPEDTSDKELERLIAESVAGQKRESKERESEFEVRVRGTREPYVLLKGRDERIPVKLNRALPRDLVRVELIKRQWNGKEQEVAQVIEVLERHPYEMVATLRYETDEQAQVLVAHPDSLIPGLARSVRLQPSAIAGTELDEQLTGRVGAEPKIPPVGMKVVLKRSANPLEPDWKLTEVIGRAGTAKVEIESIARATGVGAQYVEDMTDEELEAFAESVASNAPMLSGRLAEVKREDIVREIRELEEISRQWGKKLSTEKLVRMLYGLPEKSPKKGKTLVKNEKDYVPGENRLDLRDWDTFTIDPKDAKDFDDAISFKETKGGGLKVAVHIADVTAFVKQFSALDLVAQFRQMTRYLKAKTIPLFPEVIANELCSLVQGKDRLAFSVIFSFDKDGVPTEEPWFGRTVINSNKRYAYEEAQEEIAKSGKGRNKKLLRLKEIADAYRATRTKSGSVNFRSKDEVNFHFNGEMEPTDLFYPERMDANRLVEDFMIMGNEAVVKRIVESNPNEAVAFIRIHRPPDPDRILDLLRGLSRMGSTKYTDIWDGSAEYDPHAILQEVRKRIDEETDPLEKAEKEIEMIRAMMRAGYEVVSASEWEDSSSGAEDTGTDPAEKHFGLALRWYGHFTSPIRRYPDVIQHRLLEMALRHDPVTVHHEGTLAELTELAELATEREEHYDKAERDMRNFLLLSLLRREVYRHGPKLEATVHARGARSIVLRFPLGDGYVEQQVSLRDVATDTNRSPEEVWEALEPGKTFSVAPEIDLPLRRMKVKFDMEGTFAEADFANLAGFPTGTDLIIHRVPTKEGEEPMVGIREWTPGQKSRALVHRIAAKKIRIVDEGGVTIEPKDWHILGIKDSFRARIKVKVGPGDQELNVTFAHPLGERKDRPAPKPKKGEGKGPKKGKTRAPRPRQAPRR